MRPVSAGCADNLKFKKTDYGVDCLVESNQPYMPQDPQQRALFMKACEHSISRYDVYGNHKPLPFEKENLLQVIDQKKTFVVDNNSAWQRECKAHPDKAFIICAALSREQPNTEKLILSAALNTLGNLFTVGYYPPSGFVHIDRVDEPYVYAFNQSTLSKTNDNNDPISIRLKAMDKLSIEHDKQRIRDYLSQTLAQDNSLNSRFNHTGKANDLPTPNQVQNVLGRLKDYIKTLLPQCKYNFEHSTDVANYCYTALLLAKRPIRNEFDLPDYPNVFGDLTILGIAIYLQAHILTHDDNLKRMAEFADIKHFTTV